jgi:hypothetical protein
MTFVVSSVLAGKYWSNTLQRAMTASFHALTLNPLLDVNYAIYSFHNLPLSKPRNKIYTHFTACISCRRNPVLATPLNLQRQFAEIRESC